MVRDKGGCSIFYSDILQYNKFLVKVILKDNEFVAHARGIIKRPCMDEVPCSLLETSSISL